MSKLLGLKFVQDDIWIDGETDSGDYENRCIYNDLEYINDEFYDFRNAARKYVAYKMEVDAKTKKQKLQKEKIKEIKRKRRMEQEQIKQVQKYKNHRTLGIIDIELELMGIPVEVPTNPNSVAGFVAACIAYVIENCPNYVKYYYKYEINMELDFPVHFIFITDEYVSINLEKLYQYVMRNLKAIYINEIYYKYWFKDAKDFKSFISKNEGLVASIQSTNGYILFNKNSLEVMLKEYLKTGVDHSD